MHTPPVPRIALLATATLVGLFGASSTPAAARRAAAGRAADVDRLFAKWDRLDSPGCAVGIVSGGELIYAEGFGAANLEAGVANTPQTIFEVASASKAFTCACIALLMDEGKLHPDDELARFVPEMHKFDRTLHDNRIVTFRRDGDHRVVGCTAAFWRIKGLSFRKQSLGGQPVPHPLPPG
jgi:CubicO group peptidase (beta-lactamase class C family)